MTERIVVGLTDAPGSRRALDWAVDRAVSRGGRLELVAVVGTAVGIAGEVAVIDEALRRTEGLLAQEADRVRARGVLVETRIARGSPVERLIESSAGAALLVIGSDYRGPTSGPARGPHGIRISAGARCPVAVVPDVDPGERSGVVVGSDGSEVSELAIAFAASEADRFGEPLTVIGTWSPVPLPFGMRAYPDHYMENMQKLTEEELAISVAGLAQTYPDVEVRRVIERTTRPDLVINRLAAHARLAVIGSHGRGRIARFLLGSTSQQVLSRLATTTVVVR